jgi:hypothetical protein
MEVLCVALREALMAIIDYSEKRKSASGRHRPAEEEEELPQNLLIKMEHYEDAHRTEALKIVSDKKTPRTILKNVSHSKSSSQSTMSHNHTRPQTAAGFVTPEKNHPVAVSGINFDNDFQSKTP